MISGTAGGTAGNALVGVGYCVVLPRSVNSSLGQPLPLEDDDDKGKNGCVP